MRVAGTTLHPIELGVVSAMLLPLAIWRALYDGQGRKAAALGCCGAVRPRERANRLAVRPAGRGHRLGRHGSLPAQARQTVGHDHRAARRCRALHRRTGPDFHAVQCSHGGKFGFVDHVPHGRLPAGASAGHGPAMARHRAGNLDPDERARHLRQRVSAHRGDNGRRRSGWADRLPSGSRPRRADRRQEYRRVRTETAGSISGRRRARCHRGIRHLRLHVVPGVCTALSVFYRSVRSVLADGQESN